MSVQFVLPAPEAKLAGCTWLPRIVAKARALSTGTLPDEYAIRFGEADSVDGLFLQFFKLTKEHIMKAAQQSDEAAAQWFKNQPTVNAERIEEWNRVGINLGRAGFPMAERLPVALATKYKHIAHRRIETIFDMLKADEGLL